MESKEKSYFKNAYRTSSSGSIYRFCVKCRPEESDTGYTGKYSWFVTARLWKIDKLIRETCNDIKLKEFCYGGTMFLNENGEICVESHGNIAGYKTTTMFQNNELDEVFDAILSGAFHVFDDIDSGI